MSYTSVTRCVYCNALYENDPLKNITHRYYIQFFPLKKDERPQSLIKGYDTIMVAVQVPKINTSVENARQYRNTFIDIYRDISVLSQLGLETC